MINSKTLISAAAITALLGLGCVSMAKPHGPSYVKSAPAPVKSEFTAPIGYLKPGASVSYMHNLKSSLNVGDTVTFQLVLDEAYSTGQLNVDIAAEGALSLFIPADQLRIDMSDGAEHIIDVTVTANNDGRHYINVNAVTDQGVPRIFGIAVQVGAPIAQKPSPQMMTMPNGEKIIMMDAEEVIK